MYLFVRSRFRHLYSNTIPHTSPTNRLRPYPIRNLYATSSVRRQADQLSQGHAADPKNLHPQGVQSEAVKKGKEAKKDGKSDGIDAAKEATQAGNGKKPTKKGRGNPEGIGFVEQVGSASGSARKFEELEEAEEKK